ncbi:MAG: prepilin-type N-terminal cleavage/methylation domain-containing protein [bacterium]|nr:prepilin-type N-terminal cleavage/methylation domain-containing protein [bacterium]
MNYKNKELALRNSKGFTLVELLVVIAIIGILASIAMANLSNARKSAKDAAIKSAIQEGAKIAEIFFDDTGDYDLICADPRITGGVIEASISSNGGSFVCGDDVAGYCLSSTLNMGGSVCVDGYRELKYGFVCDVTGNDIVCD